MVLLVCISTCLLEDGCSLRWEEELKPQFINCSGEDVVFPWRYSLDVGDTLVGISWSHRPTAADKDTTFGTYGLGSFSAPDKRISQVEEAGIKLSNLSSNDSGTYIVNVRLSGRGGVHTQNTTLLVAEPPTTKTGRLEVLINDLPVSMTTQTKTATVKNGKDRLMCGHFTHLGTPPTSVVWKDPDNRILPSTSYEMGYFILELSEQSKGGNYHCMLNDSSKAVDCLPPDTQLRDTVEVKVAKSSSPSVGASMSGGIIAAIVIVVVILIAVIVVILVFVILRRRKGKSYAPKEPDSPGPEGPEDEARQPFKV